jgi:hypothetical protein
MHLRLFRSLWTNGFDLEAALSDCATDVFDGVEGPLPAEAAARAVFLRQLAGAGVPFIAEIATGGGYVPEAGLSVTDHIEDFRRQATHAAEASPILLTVLGGCDAWSPAQSIEFFERAMLIAAELDLPVSFETHRSRSTFHPWLTRDLLEALPELRLTADFSHWCCVCERLVLDEEPGLLALLATRTRHLHARVGYAQGPQVPHPAAPEYRRALDAHERWWSEVWHAQAAAGCAATTMAPEFGPDGYLHTQPFTAEPIASLDEINAWMARRQRARFAAASSFPEKRVNAAA